MPNIQRRSLLHVRGGVSGTIGVLRRARMSSPRPWRCFSILSCRLVRLLVFSTSVEVFLLDRRGSLTPDRLLHVRGGVSRNQSWFGDTHLSSPRPWRCFLKNATKSFRSPCLLHVRGGVSIRRRRFYEDGEVFSTSVEVFPLSDAPVENRLSLLHVRGGVSELKFIKMLFWESSPRPWRCFHSDGNSLRVLLVFSTSVEVFLRSNSQKWPCRRLLHVRGGVSVIGLILFLIC